MAALGFRILEPLKKMGGTPGLKKVNELVCSERDHSYFCNGSNTPARAAGGRKNATTHNGGEPFALGKSRIGFYSLRECMEETYEYANELGKQGGNFAFVQSVFFHNCVLIFSIQQHTSF